MGFIGAERDPRIVLFGDITGIPIKAIDRFLEAAGHPPYGGSFPSCHNRPEAEVAREASELLTQAGIPDSSPITPCYSEKERLRQILQNPVLLNRKDETGRPILIIDRDPKSLVQGVAHIQEDSLTELLKHITVMSLSPGEPVDYVAPGTDIRVVTLPPYCYPFHPTPAS